MYAILAAIFLLHNSPTNSLPQKLDLATALKSKPCQVVEENSTQLKSCKFPFIYKNKAYYGCTTVDGVNGKPWCSTKVSYLFTARLFVTIRSLTKGNGQQGPASWPATADYQARVH